jgi:hypothetical protein
MAGEANRRNRERTKEEIRQELQQQGYYQQQPTPATAYAPAVAPQPQVQEVHTKFNPKTGKTYPERYVYDPETGDELQYIR